MAFGRQWLSQTLRRHLEHPVSPTRIPFSHGSRKYFAGLHLYQDMLVGMSEELGAEETFLRLVVEYAASVSRKPATSGNHNAAE